MPQLLSSECVVITGASSGIGRALALAYARRGAAVGLVSRRGDLLATLADEIRRLGVDSAFAVADVACRRQVEQAWQSLRDSLGPVSKLICNAGVGTPTLLNPVNVDDVERMIHVNLLGAIYACSAALPDFLAQKRGRIVAMSSLAAFRGLPGESGYCASKAGLNAYMEGLRVQLRGTGVGVSIICPGFIDTPMTEVIPAKEKPFLMSADRAAERIVRAIQSGRKMYRFPTRTSWLMRFASWLPDWAMAKVMHGYNEAPPMNEISQQLTVDS